MMGLKFFPRFFESRSEVLDDIKRNGTWPTTFVSGPSEGLPVHFHDDEVHAYIMEGETDFLDAETGDRTPVRTGDKIVVPRHTLHAEGAVKDRVVYMLALPRPLPPEEFLVMRDANELLNRQRRKDPSLESAAGKSRHATEAPSASPPRR